MIINLRSYILKIKEYTLCIKNNFCLKCKYYIIDLRLVKPCERKKKMKDIINLEISV